MLLCLLMATAIQRVMLFSTAAMFLGLVCAFARSEPVLAPVILGVEQRLETVAPPAASPGLMTARLPKFGSRAMVQEVYTVRWRAPETGVEQGAVLWFDYRQADAPAVKSLRIQYPFSVTGERAATFVISGPAVREFGPVRAWRVRLEASGRELARRMSEAWEYRP